MKNIHQRHPEDSILTGDLSVLDAFLMPCKLSVKFDGSPSIVWGPNPETGNQFVGTKSVFNKFKIKINESHEDIDRNHTGQVAEILHACFDYLPDVDGIIQGDFIGYGGSDEYTPNTITYCFPTEVDEQIIVAPHTGYIIGEVDETVSPNLFFFAEAFPLDEYPESTECCKFVNPDAGTYTGSLYEYGSEFDLEDVVRFAKQMSTLVEFEDAKGARQLEQDLNAYIRDGDEVVAEEFENYQLIRLWLLVKSIKEDALYQCRHRWGPEAYIGQNMIDAEGYVMHTEYGTWKLVNREVFSHANFNMGVGA